MSKDVRLSDQQFQVVQAVNKLAGASAREVQRELDHLELAHTTIATVMTRLEKKGVLESEVIGRGGSIVAWSMKNLFANPW